VAVRDKQGTISIIVALLALAVMCLGFFSVEIWFAQLTLSQLKNCADAASMSAAACLVSSSPEPLPNGQPGLINNEYKYETREKAKAAAWEIITKSSVIGRSLENARRVTDASQVYDLQAGESAISVRFVDSNGTVQPISGKHIQVEAAMAVAPMSGNLLGLKSYIVRAKGTSAAAKLDLAFCLDDSLSMATDTRISMVYRGWKDDKEIKHVLINQGIASKFKTIGVPEPMYIGISKGEEDIFDPNGRGGPEGDMGTPPPGSFQSTKIPPGKFTDRVIVDLDPNNNFQPFVFEGLRFPDIATVVEASRGNLDNTNAFEKSLARSVVPAEIKVNQDYKSTYEKWALTKVEPYNRAKKEIKRFFELLEANTDSHFSLVPFSQKAAQSEDDQMKDWPVSREYPQREKVFFDFNKVEFKRANSSYNTVMTKIDSYKLHGGTAIQFALDEAVASFDGESRPDARRAILLFTDGEPTSKNGEDLAIEESIAAAGRARAKGITVFPIGFLHGGGRASERAIACLAGVAKAGGAPDEKYYMVQDVEGLHEVFRVISRRLVTLE